MRIEVDSSGIPAGIEVVLVHATLPPADPARWIDELLAPQIAWTGPTELVTDLGAKAARFDGIDDAHEHAIVVAYAFTPFVAAVIVRHVSDPAAVDAMLRSARLGEDPDAEPAALVELFR